MPYEYCRQCGRVENEWGNSCWCDIKYRPKWNKKVETTYNYESNVINRDDCLCVIDLLKFIYNTVLIVLYMILTLIYITIYYSIIISKVWYEYMKIQSS
jgi:hypothetical protein